MDNFYRNLKGDPTQGILDISETQQYPLGCRFAKNDGRVFRYMKAGGTALVAGDLIQSAPLGGATTTGQTGLTPAVAAAGTKVVTAAIDTTEQPKDTYADGWMAVTDGDAANAMGDLYLVKSHPLSATNIILTLYEPLKRAITTSSKISLLKHIYKDVIQAPTTPSGVAVGVASTVVTADYFFWGQTWGMANILVDANLVAGMDVRRDVDTAGCVGKTATTEWAEEVGTSGWAAVAGDTGFVFLTIAP